MQYQRLFRLAIAHDYYSDKICSNFVVEPTQNCCKLIKSHRLLLKPQSDGLWVMMPVTDSQQPLMPFADDASFTFLLKLNSASFLTFTNLAAEYDATQSLVVFSSDDLSESDLGTGTVSLKSSLLQLSELKQAKAEQSALAQRLSALGCLSTARQAGVFGLVELSAKAALLAAEAGTSEAGTFKASFAAKQQTWKYYLIADNGQSDTFSIADKDAAISFVLTEIDAGDRLLATIQHRFPNSQPVLFQSQQPVPCQKAGRQNIQLLKAGHTQPWIEHLPNPPDQHGIHVLNLMQEL